MLISELQVRLPALLPDELHYTQVAENEQVLMNMLVKIPQDMIAFFEYACDDETWTERHETFMESILLWFTNRFFQDRLSMDIAKRAVRAIRPHYHVLKELLPANITIKLNAHEVLDNSLMWGASSDYLRSYIIQECLSKKSTVLTFENIPLKLFSKIDEFIHTGKVEHLVYEDMQALFELIDVSRSLGLMDLALLCEKSLERYITKGNMIELIILAQEKEYSYFREECFTFVNASDAGVVFHSGSIRHLHMEFQNLRSMARKVFDQLKDYLTYLSFPGGLSDEEEFTEFVSSCPNLVGIDLASSTLFSDRLHDMPRHLKELDLSKCGWLTDSNFREIIEICPELEAISLASNTQLSYLGFSELHRLTYLKSLNISRCIQVYDTELEVIKNACRGLNAIVLEGCTSIGEKGFLDIARSLRNLQFIDLTRTYVSDYPLVELAVNCKQLSEIHLARCSSLTEKGILEFVRNAKSLQILDVTHCSVSDRMTKELKKIAPFVSIHF